MLSDPGFVRLDPSLGLAVYRRAIRMDGQVPKSSRNHCYHGRIGGHACGLPSDLYSNLTTHENELIAKEERWRYSNFSYRFNVGIDLCLYTIWANLFPVRYSQMLPWSITEFNYSREQMLSGMESSVLYAGTQNIHIIAFRISLSIVSSKPPYL